MRATVFFLILCLLTLPMVPNAASGGDLPCARSGKLGFSLLGENLAQLKQKKRPPLPLKKGYDLKTLGLQPQDSGKEPDSQGVAFSAEGDIAALVFRNRSSFTPYLGAGAQSEAAAPEEFAPPLAEDPAAPPPDFSYKLGAGVDCAVNETMRLNLGYRFLTNAFNEIVPAPAPNTLAQDDGHLFSVRLQLAF